MRGLFFGFALTVCAFAPAAWAEDRLDEKLEPIRQKHGLPALVAAVIVKDTIVARGVAGVRMLGTDIKATIDDRFHLGSDTKALTATLAGIMVEEGKLQWTSTIGEVLGPKISGLKPKFAAIPLNQLLSHTSGIPSDNDEIGALYFSGGIYDVPLTEFRRKLISDWGTKHEPENNDPHPFAYSNLGYTIVGAMIEEAAGEPWDSLMFKRIYEPLELKSAGIGPQATFGKIDAAIGHEVTDSGAIVARPWGPAADAPVVIGPAGIAHMNVSDFVKWASWNAAEGKRGPALIKPETLKLLHQQHVTMKIANPPPGTPDSGGYGYGWGIVQFSWAEKPMLSHNGSNSFNFATIVIDVDNDAAIAVMTNIGGPKADDAAKEVLGVLYPAYVKAAKP